MDFETAVKMEICREIATNAGVPRRPMASLEQQWHLAVAWYENLLTVESRRPGSEEMVGIFAALGLGVMLLVMPPAPLRGAEPETSFRAVLEHHLARYPELQIEDLYKLVFQAALGPEHAAPSMDAARGWLERELNDLGPGPAGPIEEPLSPDGRLVRVHLRAFVQQHGDTELLLQAFLATAERFEGSRETLRRYWDELESLAAAGQMPFEGSELEDFFQSMEAEGFPAVHHSAVYRRRYRPAYRVVLRELLQTDDETPRR